MVSRHLILGAGDGRAHLLGLEGRGDALDVELLLAHELAQTLSRVHDCGAASHAHNGAVRDVLVHSLARRLHYQGMERGRDVAVSQLCAEGGGLFTQHAPFAWPAQSRSTSCSLDGSIWNAQLHRKHGPPANHN